LTPLFILIYQDLTPLFILLELAKTDFLINTDARSVLVCSPWEQLVNRRPFTRFADSLSRELANSFSATGFYQSLPDVRNKLQILRGQISLSNLVRLDELEGWVLSDAGIIPVAGEPFQVFQIDVRVAGREVANWDQPVISSIGNGYVELVCGRFNGILCFLFIPRIEAGLHNRVELGPTKMVASCDTMPTCSNLSCPGAIVLAKCKQSDEGGRFYQDTSIYCLVDSGVVFEPSEHGYWLTLAQISTLLREGGWFTNEARSALSLLLTWV
jgi:dTDP-4-dehydro-6-deoxy-alpha-D-glucopyranose 2,3-dehydratase